jgi:O-antigen/teichoic acid export membrane protein
VGLIQKQSISGTIYSYIGVGLGFITTAILFTHFFNTEQVGLFRILVSYSILFAQFAGLGINSITVKLFPYFRNHEKKHHGFLGIALIIGTVGLLLSVSAFVLLRPEILSNSEGKSDLFDQYFYYVIPLIVFTLLFNVFDTYYRVLYNAVKGIIYKEIVQRILILVAIIPYYYNIFDFPQTVLLYCFAIISPGLLLFASLIYNKKLHINPDFKFIDRSLRNEMISVGFFGIVASFSGVISMTIDTIMVEKYLGLSAAGIYSITFFFGTLILVPIRTMGKISSVVISDAWKDNNLSIIDDIYKKSSISLSVIGVLLIIGIWGNINNVFHIITDSYLPGKYVILLIGLANLADILTGVSPQILLYSKHYRYFSYFLISYVIIFIIANIILIPIFGLIGAAVATLISKILYNFIKFIFLYKKYKLQPFTYKTVLLYLIGGFAYILSTLLPEFSNFIVDIIFRSLLITVAFIIPVYYFNISEDISERIDVYVRKIFG